MIIQERPRGSLKSHSVRVARLMLLTLPTSST